MENNSQDFAGLTKEQAKAKMETINKSASGSFYHVSDQMAEVMDSIKALGAERTYTISSNTKFNLFVDQRTGETLNTPFFGKTQASKFKEVLNDKMLKMKQLKPEEQASYLEQLREYGEKRRNYDTVIQRRKELDTLLENTTKVNHVATAIINDAEHSARRLPNMANTEIDEKYLAQAFESYVDSNANVTYNNIQALRDTKIKAINDMASGEKKLAIVKDKMALLKAKEDEIYAGFVNKLGEDSPYLKDLHLFDLTKSMPDHKPSTITEFSKIVTRITSQINGTDYNETYPMVEERVKNYIRVFDEQQALEKELSGISIKSIDEKIAEATQSHEKWLTVDGNNMDEEMAKDFKRFLKLHQQKLYEPIEPVDKMQLEREKVIKEAYDEAFGADIKGEKISNNRLKFQPIALADFEDALGTIDDPTLRGLIEAMYTNGENDMKVPRSFLGITDIQSADDGNKHIIRGIADINTEGFDLRYAIENHLTATDAYGIVQDMQNERLALSDGTNVKSVADQVNAYREMQRELSIEQKQAQYLSISVGDDISEVMQNKIGGVSAVTSAQTGSIPQRLKNLVGDTSLIDGPTKGRLRRDKDGNILRPKPKPPVPGKQQGLSLAMKGLAEQTKFKEIRVEAQDLRSSLAIFKGFQHELETANYMAIQASISRSADAGPIYGMVGSAYREVMERGGLDYNVNLGTLPKNIQEEVVQRMNVAMVDKLDNSLYGLQAALQKEVDSSPYINEIYNALGEHQSIVGSMEREYDDMFDRGTTQRDTGKLKREILEEKFEMAGDQNKAVNEMYDTLYEAMDLQEELMVSYHGSAVAKKDKKDVKAYVAGVKNNYELKEAIDIGTINERPASHFLFEELKRGSVTMDGKEIPLQNFKQFYVMNSMKDIMGENWSHFTPEEWDSGQVSFGKTTMPITQMSEYYTPFEREYHVNRLESLTPGSISKVKRNADLTPQDIRTFWQYASIEDSFNTGNNLIVARKPIDQKLSEKLQKAKDNGQEITTRGNVVPYTVEDVDSEFGVATLKERHVELNPTDSKAKPSFSLVWEGEGSLYDKIKEAEELANKFSPIEYDTPLEKQYNNAMLDRTIGTSKLTRREMLEAATKGEGGMPKLVSDMVDSSFSWMRLSQESADEMLGQAYISTVKAFGEVDDLTILRAFGEVSPDNFRELPLAAKNEIINNAFAHRIETSMLIGVMDQMSNGGQHDSYDTAIRAARTVASSEGVANPTTDQIRDYLMRIEKGMSKMTSSETREYFNAVGELSKSPTMISERMAKGSSIAPLSIEDIREKIAKDIDDDTIEHFIEKTLGLNANSQEGEQISQTIGKLSYQGASDDPDFGKKLIDEIYPHYEKDAVESYYGKDIKQILGFDVEDIQREYSKEIKKIKKSKSGKNTRILETDISASLKSALDRLTTGNTNMPPKLQQDILDANDIIVNNILNKNKQAKKLVSTGRFSPTGKIESELIKKYLSENIASEYKPVTKTIKMTALYNMNQMEPGSALAYIQASGGIEKSFSEIFGVNIEEVGSLKAVENNIRHLEFGSVEEMRNFTKMTSDIIPGLTLSVSFKDNDGRTVKGTVGGITDPEGFSENIMVSTDGDKYRIVNSSSEAVRHYSIGDKISSDVTIAKENKAKYHISAPGGGKNKYKAVAGFIGNYDMITRRPGYNTKAPTLDPISTFNNLNNFKKGGKGLLFDFETTGLPGNITKELGEGYAKAFAPIELAYTTVDASNLDVKKANVQSVYVRPNDTVKEVFKMAMDKEYDAANLGMTNTIGKVGKESATYSMLSNYGKYDTSRVYFGEKSYTWGSVITSQMALGEDGKISVSINDEIINTGMTFDEMQAQTKTSAQKVFNYLDTTKETTKRGKFGINPASIMTEEEFVTHFANKVGSHDFLIGHNISTADMPWAKIWADRVEESKTSKKDIEEIKAITNQLKSTGNKIVDTQDLLQASNSGRRSNNLETYATNKAKSHLAYADVITNAKALKSLMKDKQVMAIAQQVDEGLPMGSFIQKTRSSKLGMDIPNGVYKVVKIGETKKNQGLLGLQRVLPDGTLEKAKTYRGSNLAVVRKELADNWLNVGTELEQAVLREQARIRQNASRTFMNGSASGAIDRYMHMSSHGNFDFQRDLINEFRTIQEDNQTFLSQLPQPNKDVAYDRPRFSSQSVDDMSLFLQSNAKRLTNDGYKKEMMYLNSLDKNRTPELKHMSAYFDTDEGKMVRDTIEQIQTRFEAGIYSASERNKAGRGVYNAITEFKRQAVESGKLGSEYMIQVPDKYIAGTIKFEDLTGEMQKYLSKSKASFGEMPITLSLHSSEQVKGDIFGAGEQIAKMIRNMEGVDDINVARQKVVNEVILPILSEKYSTNKKLNKAIASRLVNEVDDDYLNAVYTMSSELVANKEKVIKKMQPLAVVDTMAPISSANKELFEELQVVLKGVLANHDKEKTHLIEIEDGVRKYVPIDGAEETLERIVSIQQKNKQQTLDTLASSEAYKSLVAKHGYDPIAEGINPLPMWNYSLLNSVGLTESAALDGIKEFRFTSKEKNKWMQNKTAKELSDILQKLPSYSNAHDYLDVVEAFANKDQKSLNAQLSYKKTHQNIIEDIETRIKALNKNGLSDISHIKDINENLIKNWSSEYASNASSAIQGNRRHRGEITRELYKRAQLRDSLYGTDDAIRSLGSTGFISEAQMNTNPTKYNAMKQVGLLQAADDGRYFTGGIGLPGEKGKLDPSKIIVPGNKEASVIDAVSGKPRKISVNQYAGMPLDALTLPELEFVAKNEKAPYSTSLFEDYYDKLKQMSTEEIKSYNNNAHIAKQAFYDKDKSLKRTNLRQLVPEYAKSLGDTDHISAINKATVEAGSTPRPKPKYAEAFDTMNKYFTDSPLYQSVKSNTESAFEFIGQHKKGFAIGAAALGVLAALKLTKPKSSNGRASNQMPQANQAPAVDGTYETEYNKHENKNEHFIPNTKTIRLEEGGGGLNVRARGVNRKGTSDGDFDRAFGEAFGSYGASANVAIKHSDDRASINNEYVQGLVSNALF